MTASAIAEPSPSSSPSPSPSHAKENENENENENGDLKHSAGPVVYSFRPQPHAHRNDGSAVVHSLPHSEPAGWYLFVQLLFSMIMVHYFLWSIVCIVFVLFVGYFHWSFALVAIAAYLPSFLNGDQFKGVGRPWEWFRRHPAWHLIQDYMQVEIVRTAKLDSNKQYIFGAYPHGILILSRAATYGGLWERLFPGIDFRVLGASPMFYIPGCRELCLWMGAINAAKKTAEQAISKYKKSLIVYPGGSAEIFTTDPNSTDTVLIVRKGFIKLAIQQGADVVPVFVFGEKWLYHRRFLPRTIHNFFMNALRTPLILFWGIWGTWLPRRLPLSMVFGKPISCPKNADPSHEEIDAVWNEYRTQLQGLFDSYKSVYGYGQEEKLVFKDAKETKKHV